MTNLSDEERRVLRALGELAPATLEELAARTGMLTSQIKDILKKLTDKGLLSSLDSDEFESSEKDSDSVQP
jgi:DNA-binding MarR family transcriptional regulator